MSNSAFAALARKSKVHLPIQTLVFMQLFVDHWKVMMGQRLGTLHLLINRLRKSGLRTLEHHEEVTLCKGSPELTARAIDVDDYRDEYERHGLISPSEMLLQLDKVGSVTASQDFEPSQIPVFTIAVPVKYPNGLLLRSLRSLKQQSQAHFECLIVDDGMPVDLREKVLISTLGDKRFKLIQNDGQGTYSARNSALRNAKGIFFAVLDSDDVLHPAALDRMEKALEDEPWDFAALGLMFRVAGRTVVRPNSGPTVATPHLSMLTLRTVFLREKMGGWIEMNSGADNEFLARYIASVGLSKLKLVNGPPMGFCEAREGSLSRLSESKNHEFFSSKDFFRIVYLNSLMTKKDAKDVGERTTSFLPNTPEQLQDGNSFRFFQTVIVSGLQQKNRGLEVAGSNSARLIVLPRKSFSMQSKSVYKLCRFEKGLFFPPVRGLAKSVEIQYNHRMGTDAILSLKSRNIVRYCLTCGKDCWRMNAWIESNLETVRQRR